MNTDNPSKDPISEEENEKIIDENNQESSTEELHFTTEPVDSDHEIEEDPEFLPSPSIKKLLFSPDSPSRLMTFFSIFFALLASLCMILLISAYLNYRKELAKQKVIPVKEAKTLQVNLQSLGEFKLVLKPENRINDGELRVNIVVECKTQNSCNKLKDHLSEARDLVIPVLSVASREDLLTLESKNRIKRTIAERLSNLTDPEKVQDINFSDMTIEPGPK